MSNFDGIEVIGFDLDNTLYRQSPEVDAEIQGYIFERAAGILGITVEDAQEQFDAYYQDGKGISGGASLRQMGVDTNEHNLVQEALEHADVASALSPNQEDIDLLERLFERYRSVDIITGSDRTQTYRKLAALGIEAGNFGIIMTGEHYDKASGHAYLLWLTRYPRLVGNQFLYVGDRQHVDGEAPQRHGIKTALVNVAIDKSVGIPQFETLQDFGDSLLRD